MNEKILQETEIIGVPKLHFIRQFQFNKGEAHDMQ